MSKVYFPGLNGIRFFAAFMVLLDHLELFKGYIGLKSFWSDNYSSLLGSMGVTIFFVLSGFLITYLLLTEKKRTLKINILNFYIRRILRIWPLYYLVLILSFFIFPHIKFLNFPLYSNDISILFMEKFILFLAMLPNVAFVYLPIVPFGNVLWSVGVEEQFYLLWPLIIYRCKKILFVMLILLSAYLFIKINSDILKLSYFADLIERTRFSCMIIGAIGAFLLINKKAWVEKYIYSKSTQLIMWSLFIVSVIFFPQLPKLKNEYFSLIIILLILNTGGNKSPLLSLENKTLNYLGKISYGFYVYHLLGVVISLKFLKQFYVGNGAEYFIWSFFVLLLSFVISTIIAHCSYEYFEKPILKRKEKYSAVLSGDLVKE